MRDAFIIPLCQEASKFHTESGLAAAELLRAVFPYDTRPDMNTNDTSFSFPQAQGPLPQEQIASCGTEDCAAACKGSTCTSAYQTLELSLAPMCLPCYQTLWYGAGDCAAAGGRRTGASVTRRS